MIIGIMLQNTLQKPQSKVKTGRSLTVLELPLPFLNSLAFLTHAPHFNHKLTAFKDDAKKKKEKKTNLSIIIISKYRYLLIVNKLCYAADLFPLVIFRYISCVFIDFHV